MAAGNVPAHRTIRDFRALHLKELSELFVQGVRLARQMGLVKRGTSAVEGTKVKAMSHDRMRAAERQFNSQIDALRGPVPTTRRSRAARTANPRAVKDNLGVTPEQALADTGCRGGAVFEQLADCGCDLVIALGREGKQPQRFDPQRSPHTAAMAAKLQTESGRSAYWRRKWIAEPANGWIKNVPGFRPFSLRGLDRVQAEWRLVCMALNLRRMASMQPA